MPIDGSPYSKAALAFFASRSSLIENQPDVELLNVQYPVSARVVRGAGRELVKQPLESEANRVIKPAGLRAVYRATVGNPGVEIDRIEGEGGVDLIVMGSQGDT